MREVVSRGQQKLLGIAMAVALTRHIAQDTHRSLTLLLDDPAAELDPLRTQALLETVQGLNAQLVVTALRPDQTPLEKPEAVFHVERGIVKRL